MGRGALKDACPLGLRWREQVVTTIIAAHSLWAVNASRSPDSQAIIEAPDVHDTNSSGQVLDDDRGAVVLYDPTAKAIALHPHYSVWHDGGRDAGKSSAPSVWNFLVDAVSGTGAAPGSTGDLVLDRMLLQRMRLQDQVVMLFLLIAYIGTLLYCAYFAYRQSVNSSLVTYYADPRYYTEFAEGDELEGFLEAFHVPPKDVHLQVTGFAPLPSLHDGFVDPAVDWLGSRYRVVFSFALDLSLWLVPDDRYSAASRVDNMTGISAEDLDRLADFLQHDENDLAAVEIHKEVHWSDWEELATNIKHQIRQSGFTGIIHVCCTEDEVMTIYKNKAWANFMYRRITKVLCALSLIGWLVYQPYIWLRHRALVVTSRYRIEVAIGNYWPLIADKVGPDGFSSR
mmetsp:Transcript_30418/g.87188  ORF Transcript_30418/g.87188 Transcript_30418/m.87188 type:complete len:398 (-) Transcript_30418:61-1254(-)